ALYRPTNPFHTRRSSDLASCLAMDKIATKRLWLQHGLPTPQFAELAGDADPSGLVASLGLPLIIKPPHEGSTLGLTRVESPDQLDRKSTRLNSSHVKISY